MNSELCRLSSDCINVQCRLTQWPPVSRLKVNSYVIFSEPPDKTVKKKSTERPSTVFIVTQGSDVIKGSTSTSTKAKPTKNRNSIYRSTTQYDKSASKIHIDIYKTVYYLFIFIHKLFSSS